MGEPARVAVLASGSGTNLQALIDACASPVFPAEIAVVLSNRPKAFALERARAAGIATEVVLRRDHRERSAWDAEAVRRLRGHGIDWVCLAGFMRIVTPEFLDAFPHRVLNIHPSLLPAFRGLNAQEQALAAGVRIAGCTVHLVDAGTDTGPIIVQGAVPVRHGDDAAALGARILALEHQLFPLALRWAAEGRLSIDSGKVSVTDDPDTWILGTP
jgi:phosphoribosylglycinamide formyltransferase-1